MNIMQLRAYIVRPALQHLAPLVPYSQAAENLVLGTALTESRGEYVQQVGGGPARSLWQIEPATEADLWRWLERYAELARRIERLMWLEPALDNLTGNLFYGAVMCRVFYRRLPDPIPADPLGMAELWKRRYNTALGAGTVDKALPFFNQACGV